MFAVACISICTFSAADHTSGHMPDRISALFGIFAVLPFIAALVTVAAVVCAFGVKRKSSRNKGI